MTLPKFLLGDFVTYTNPNNGETTPFEIIGLADPEDLSFETWYRVFGLDGEARVNEAYLT